MKNVIVEAGFLNKNGQEMVAKKTEINHDAVSICGGGRRDCA